MVFGLSIEEILPIMIIAIFILALLIFAPTLQTKETIGSLQEQMEKISGNSLSFLNEIKSDITYIENENKYTYIITVSPRMAYTGEIERDILVIPVIEYKDKSSRATVKIGPNSGGNIVIPKNDPKFDGVIETTIVSRIPPIKEFDSGPLIEGQKVIVKSPKGKFLVGVVDFFTKIQERVSINPMRIISPPCWVKFSVENKNTLNYISLKKCDDENMEDCEKNVNFDNGGVKIKISDIDKCSSVNTFLSAEGGEEQYEWIITEKVIISFWKYTDCTKDLQTYDELDRNCFNDYINDQLARKDIEVPLKNIKPFSG